MLYETFIKREFLPTVKEKNNYADSYFCQFRRHVFPIIGDLELEAIQPSHIETILDNMYLRGLSNSTVVNAYYLIKWTFQLAISLDIIHRNPCILSIHILSGKRYTYPEDLETHREIVSSIDNIPLRNIFGFSYMTGFNISQLLLLHRDDYDRVSQILTVKTGWKKGRFLIRDCALPYIEAELEKQDHLPFVENNLLFVEDDGTRIKRTHETFSTHLLRFYLRKPDFTAKDLSRAHGNMLQLTQGDV